MNIIGKPLDLQMRRIGEKKTIVYTALATDEVPKQYIELETGDIKKFRGGIAVTDKAYINRYRRASIAFIVNDSLVCYNQAAFTWSIYDRQAEQNIIDCILDDAIRQRWTSTTLNHLVNVSVFQNAMQLRPKEIGTTAYWEAQPRLYQPGDIGGVLTLYRVATRIHRSILCRTPAGYRIIWSPLALLTDKLWPFVKQAMQEQSTISASQYTMNNDFERELYWAAAHCTKYFTAVFEHEYFQAGMTPAEVERANAFRWMNIANQDISMLPD